MENQLIAKTADGRDWPIYVLDIFQVDYYPNKEYIAYTFGENVDENSIKSYISILNENENYISLDSITNNDELKIVEEAYQNMLLEGVNA